MSSLRTLLWVAPNAGTAFLCGFLVSLIFVTDLAAQDVRDSVGPTEKQARPITPENPIPRRTFSVPATYPAEARSIDAIGTVSLVATIDETGRVVEIRKVREPLVLTPSASTNPTATRIAAEAMVRDAASALRRWTYAPPTDGPIAFGVTFSFKPGAEPTASQATAIPAVPSGQAAAAASLSGVASPGGPNQPVRVGGSIKAPTQISKVQPVYPLIAQSARVSGVVILEAVIGVDGRVTDARVLRSIPLLDQAALDAVRQWVYTPTLMNGVPVPVIMTVTVTFTLPPAPDATPQQ
jgi:protein TonB